MIVEDSNFYSPLFRIKKIADHKDIVRIYCMLLREFYSGNDELKHNIFYLKKIIDDTKQVNRIIGIDGTTEQELISYHNDMIKSVEESLNNTTQSDMYDEEFINKSCYVCLCHLKNMYNGITEIYYELLETSLELTNLFHIPKEKTYTA